MPSYNPIHPTPKKRRIRGLEANKHSIEIKRILNKILILLRYFRALIFELFEKLNASFKYLGIRVEPKTIFSRPRATHALEKPENSTIVNCYKPKKKCYKN